MKTLVIYISILFAFSLARCSSNEKKPDFDNNNSNFHDDDQLIDSNLKHSSTTDTIDSLSFSILHKFIGTDIKLFSTLYFTEGYVVSDTLFESEDGIEWPGLLLKKSDCQVALFETSWQNPKEISRITLLSDEIMTTDSVRVGDKFGKIRRHISSEIPTMPDGYFAVRSKNMPSVLYFLETNDRMFYGNITINQIPSKQKVINILLQQY